ncbi:pyridoxamine 5'-phosphate oxidase family protein [Clostridium estertheticum]|uniref:pyridoxamine 5'-phosphate oxidase family protein n=1 Tax=Clostridium estertheticum TaxID=238834 RepID=UPI001C0C37E2|nr:pyridoxamine 5'-phosphate oxidase family protein [Clostridium estertheticum]MBU3177551.1 pyridoxamine 5'-phosphate oxidase family protein [Clostridium estertheticum]
MINFEEILNKKVNGVLATIGENGPQTRVFQSLWSENNKVYFCTGSQKDVFKQLVSNPKASYCVENKFSPVMSVNGDVSIIEEMEYKERAFQILPMLKNLYQEPTNPNFKVFCINIKQVKTFSYAEGPKEYSL